MNAINRAATSIFDILLTPFEALGTEVSLILVSGLFGILALLVFKQISWQKGIKTTKDKIKGDMIAIRLYQDDLVIVGKSVTKVFFRNFQYLALNFGPILPLFIPFMLVAAQLVVRYGFDPLPVVETEEEFAGLLPGEGTLIEVQLREGREREVSDLTLRLPAGVQELGVPSTPEGESIVPFRSPGDGQAYLEVVARNPVRGEIEIYLGNERIGAKEIVAGTERPRSMQPERVGTFLASWLWPAEDIFSKESPIERVTFVNEGYPEHELRYLPDGPFGILVTFLLASMVFGILILKPLNIQI